MVGLKTFAAVASAALLGGAMASAAVTRANGQDAPAGGAGAVAEKCLVQVDRVAGSGSFSVTRLVRNDGQCVCIAKTGPQGQGGGAESSVAGLLNSRSCADAPPAVEEAAASAGGLGGGLLAVVGAGGAGGVAAAAGGGGSDSPGS
jgi:hypothetical protein